jgi:hypothetical protein
MIGIAIANSLGFTGPSVLPDASAQAYFAATGITGTTQQAAINNLIKGLKADGIWSKMKAVYPFVTDNRNLLSYTEDFSNAYWSVNNATTSINSTTAPNGTNTADTFIEDSTTSFKYIINPATINGTLGETYTVSIYAKANTLSTIQLTYSSAEFNNNYANFNLSNGSIGTYSGVQPTITSVGNGWYRCSMTNTMTSSGSIRFFVILTNSSSATRAQSYLGTGKSVYIWGAQLELGSTATTYQPIATTQQAYIASQFKFNLVNPVDSDAAFRLVFNGGWTHSSNGATPNGTNGYADTKFNNQGNWTATSNGSLGISIATNPIAGVQCDMGSGSIADGANSSILYSRFSGDVYYGGLNCTSVILGNANTSSIGFFVASRINTTQHSIYKRGSSTINSTATNPIGLNPNKTIYIGAGNSNITNIPANYSDRRYNYSFIGDGLTQSEVDLYYSRITTFNTALSR